MKPSYPEHWPQFYTATVHQWKHLLSDNKHKDIITGSLKFMVEQKRIILYAFVIMANHIHLIWQPGAGYTLSEIQSSFMKYTGQQLKRSLMNNNPEILKMLQVNTYDRKYQVWKRESLSIELRSNKVFEQKLAYIHYNPVKAGLCAQPEEYYYSSARFYHDGTDKFDMLVHYSGN